MIHAWPSTSGDYRETEVFRNTVDCGPSKRCGFGLYLGADAWYVTDSFGGQVHHNTIRNAELGVNIDDVHDMAVWNNPVHDPAQSTQGSCGRRDTGAYNMGSRSQNVDTSRDTTPVEYTRVDWDGCIPNWWRR